MNGKLRGMVVLLAAVAIGGPAGARAAERDTAGSGTKEMGTGAADAGAKALSKKLIEGLEKLHAGNQAEIESGKLAQQSATSSDVKSFGEKMVTDHGQNDKTLTSMVQGLGVSLEGKDFAKALKDAQDRAASLAKKTGADFDKAYMKDMVKDHEKDSKDVRKLAEEARKEGQTDAATFLDQTEQTMVGHLAMAKQIESAVKNEKKTASKKKSEASSGYGTSMGSPPAKAD